eukprot:gene12150-15262_t
MTAYNTDALLEPLLVASSRENDTHIHNDTDALLEPLLVASSREDDTPIHNQCHNRSLAPGLPKPDPLDHTHGGGGKPAPLHHSHEHSNICNHLSVPPASKPDPLDHTHGVGGKPAPLHHSHEHSNSCNHLSAPPAPKPDPLDHTHGGGGKPTPLHHSHEHSKSCSHVTVPVASKAHLHDHAHTSHSHSHCDDLNVPHSHGHTHSFDSSTAHSHTLGNALMHDPSSVQSHSLGQAHGQQGTKASVFPPASTDLLLIHIATSKEPADTNRLQTTLTTTTSADAHAYAHPHRCCHEKKVIAACVFELGCLAHSFLTGLALGVTVDIAAYMFELGCLAHSFLIRLALGVTVDIAAYMFELGCLAHSFLIGLALGVTVDGRKAVVALCIALSFHQCLEGLGLGSVVVKAGFSRLKFPSSYSKPTSNPPMGWRGIMVSKATPQSVAAVAVQGALNCVSGGMLLYISLVQLIAEDFSRDDLSFPSSARLKLWSYVSLCMGAFFIIKCLPDACASTSSCQPVGTLPDLKNQMLAVCMWLELVADKTAPYTLPDLKESGCLQDACG